MYSQLTTKLASVNQSYY